MQTDGVSMKSLFVPLLDSCTPSSCVVMPDFVSEALPPDHSLFLQEASQPLNLTSKPKGMELRKTSSPQSLELGSLGLQGAYRPRDLQREVSNSPPRSALSE
ncbi:hypothetical protein XENOCAPTIV_005627 [Xenoophorus captivus]|uniref:Uncharacterized protein n=1 Tax=Xenoophorus captivus TaxID=1517983 RepID=A0ABV0RZ55_9TELE